MKKIIIVILLLISSYCYAECLNPKTMSSTYTYTIHCSAGMDCSKGIKYYENWQAAHPTIYITDIEFIVDKKYNIIGSKIQGYTCDKSIITNK
jgi:hypothetical protein